MQKNKFLGKLCNTFMVLTLIVFPHCGQPPAKLANIEIIDFVGELEALSNRPIQVKDIQQFKEKYPRFFSLWFSEIMDYKKFQGFSDSFFASNFSRFIQVNRPIFKAMNAHFAKYPTMSESLNQQWGNLQRDLPGTSTPTVYAYFSQFSNYNTFYDSVNGQVILGYSKEMFMNDTFPVYAMLEVPEFFNRYNSPTQIPTMLIWNYLSSKYKPLHKPENMLAQAVLEGKIWALLIHISDQENPHLNLGYTEEEWAFMERDQGQMWKLFLQNDLLYSKNFNDYVRFFVYGNKTFASGVPPECPPMIGSFIGLKIIQKYMDETDCTWSELFSETDANKILRLSGYNPAR